MSRFYIELTNENGKIVGLSGNKRIEVHAIVGNKRVASLTLRDSENGPVILNDNGDDISTAT